MRIAMDAPHARAMVAVAKRGYHAELANGEGRHGFPRGALGPVTWASRNDEEPMCQVRSGGDSG